MSDYDDLSWQLKAFIIFLMCLSSLGLIIPVIYGMPNLSLLGSYLAVPILAGSIIYLKYYKHSVDDPYYINNIYFKIFLIFFILAFILSIFFLRAFDIRPRIYYIIISIMIMIVLCEIFLFNLKSSKIQIILAQISVLSLNIIWGVTLKYYFFIDRTDTLFHNWWLYNLIETGFVSDVFDVYKDFPLWHIINCILYLVLNIDVPTVRIMNICSGICYICLVLAIYILVLKINPDIRLALFCTLFISFYPDIVFNGMSSYSRTAVLPLMIILMYFLLDRKLNMAKNVMVLLLSFALIIYHTVSMPFILIILFLAQYNQYFYKSDKKMNILEKKYYLLIIVTTFAYYIFHAESLFHALIEAMVMPSPLDIQPKVIYNQPYIELFNYLQYSFIIFFVILGALFQLRSDKNLKLKRFIFVGLILSSISFPGPALLISKLMGNFNIERFGDYAFAFIIIAAAAGFVELYIRLTNNKRALLLILFLFMTLLSVSNDFVASDNPLIKRPFYTFYITKEERDAFERIGSITIGDINSDYVTLRYFQSSNYSQKSNILEIYNYSEILRYNNSAIILFRSGEFKKRPLKCYTANTKRFVSNPGLYNVKYSLEYYGREHPFFKNLAKFNKIYNSNNIDAYI